MQPNAACLSEDLTFDDTVFRRPQRLEQPSVTAPAPAAEAPAEPTATDAGATPRERRVHRFEKSRKAMADYRTVISPRPSTDVPAAESQSTMQPLESLPLMMAGRAAIAGMPAEKPVKPGRRIERLGLGAAFAMTAALAAVLLQQPESASAAAEIPAAPARVIPSLPAMRAVAEAYFEARTPQEKVRLVRGGAAMLPAMEAHYQTHPDEPSGFHYEEHVERTDLPAAGGSVFVNLLGRDDGGMPLCVLLHCTADGVRLDWRALSGAGDMGWEQWLREQPQQPVLCRVEATPYPYAPSLLGDSSEMFTLRISDAAFTSTALAGVERKSPLGQRLTEIFSTPDGAPPKQLRIAAVLECPAGASASDPCARILSVSPHGWCDLSPEATGTP